MSLSAKQKADTRKELRENFEKSGLSVERIAADLGAIPKRIEKLFAANVFYGLTDGGRENAYGKHQQTRPRLYGHEPFQ